jgi:O-antigen/teichoic acid export membrane protein
MLKYGLPLVPAGLASMLLSVSDRYILQGLVSPSDLGIYSLGYRLGMIVQVLIIGPFTIAWGPFLWAVSSQNEAKAIYASVLKYFLAISLFVSLTVSLFAKEIVNLIAVPEYLNAFKIVPYVTISYVFYGLYYVFSPGINLQSKTKYLPFIVGASALINIVLNYQLIPVYGIMGAAASTSIAYLLLPIGTYFASRRYYPISYNWVQVSKIGLIYILCLWIPRVLDNQMDQYELVLKILLVIGFPAVLYLVKYIDKNDVHQIRKMVG